MKHHHVLGGLLLPLLLQVSACDALISTQQRIDRASAALDTGNLGRAAIELQKAAKSEPQNPKVRFLLAQLALAAGDPNAAKDYLDRAIAGGITDPLVPSMRVETLLMGNQPQALIDAITANQIVLPEPARSVALARAALEAGKPDQALTTLQPVLSSDPKSIEVRVVRAQALAQKGDLDGALAQAKEVVADAPEAYEGQQIEGRVLLALGQSAAAEAALDSALKHLPPGVNLPTQGFLLAALTEAQLAQKKLTEAAATYQKLAQRLPEAQATRLLGGRIKLARGDAKGAVSDLQKLTTDYPDFTEAQVALGAAEMTQGSLEQAQQELSQVVHAAPDNVEARKLLAQVQLQLQRPGDAAQSLTVGPAAGDPQLYSLLGQARVQNGEAGAAINTLERGVRSNPADVALKVQLAQAYLAAGRTRDVLTLTADDKLVDPRLDMLRIDAMALERGADAARAEVERLLAARPKNVSTLNFAAAYYASQNEPTRARSLLQTALSIAPHDVSTLVNSARLSLAGGDAHTAEAQLRSALAADERSVEARTSLAGVLARNGAVNDAVKLVQTGIDQAKSPDDVVALQFALARVQLLAGKTTDASALLDKLVAAHPDRADVANEAGLLLLAARQPEGALKQFKSAVGVAASNAEYVYNVGRTQLALKQPADARDSFERAAQLRAEWLPPVAALAVLDLREKGVDAALTRVNGVLAKRAGDANVMLLKGDVQAAAGRFADAVETYGQVQKVHPSTDVVLKLYQARVGAHQADPEQPLVAWLPSHPRDARVHAALGEYYLATGKLAQSTPQLEAATAQAPDDVSSLNNLAWAYQQLKDARAQAVAEKAYQLAPNSPEITDTYGWILVQAHATDRALPLLEKASRAATDPTIQYHYAVALVDAKRPKEARDVLTKALAGKSNFAGRGDAEQLLGQLKE
jgi:putative PEP-CTERM system TPR-repeat lipoprotein